MIGCVACVSDRVSYIGGRELLGMTQIRGIWRAVVIYPGGFQKLVRYVCGGGMPCEAMYIFLAFSIINIDNLDIGHG